MERPVTSASNGLAVEEPEQALEPTRLPLHAILGVACPQASFAADGADAAPEAKRLVGNFPQAFSHIGLINTAMGLERALAARPAP